MSPTTLTEGTYTYFVECEDANGCVSPRAAVTLTIDAKPVRSIIASETICENGTITDITPIGAAGSTFTVVGPVTSVGPQTLFTQANLQTAGLDETTAGIYNSI